MKMEAMARGESREEVSGYTAEKPTKRWIETSGMHPKEKRRVTSGCVFPRFF
jgi:hypothetical protein